MCQLLKRYLVLILACLAVGLPEAYVDRALATRPAVAQRNGVVGWQTVPAILARIKVPKFPKRDFKITDYGARFGDDADNTEAIRKTIDACHASGGGRVVVPPGVFQTGAIHLKSNVNLHLADGATLKFSTDPAKYLPVVTRASRGPSV